MADKIMVLMRIALRSNMSEHGVGESFERLVAEWFPLGIWSRARRRLFHSYSWIER